MARAKYIFGVLCLASLFCVPSYGSCAESRETSAEVVSMSKTDFERLHSINMMQSETLQQSDEDLQTAKNQLIESNTALEKAREQLTESEKQIKQLREQLNASKRALTISQSETEVLQNNLQEQRAETQRLQTRLIMLQQQSENAENEIERANKSLQDTLMRFKENEREHERRERSLKNRATFWQIVAVACGVAMFR
ncbi:hypothetical protein [Selenomonas artemidis]|jgi:hypothetical protein|uniref:hypothetical protein n=1 Tax=Selenomonas artemidis TaxID=671224 RepID=UPI00205C82FF|nr:hypothetical protein [Selenomonas artemidis]DAF35324.1 MAG TPA: chromosome segregation protein [Caudoviricetes sp.]